MKKIILMISCAMMLIVASCSQGEDDRSPSIPAWNGDLSAPDGFTDGIAPDSGTAVNVETATELAYIGHVVNGSLRRADNYLETAKVFLPEFDPDKTDWQKAQDAQTLKGVKIVLTQDINLNGRTDFPMIGRLLRTTRGTPGRGGVPNTIVGAPDATEQVPKYTARAGTPFAGKFDGGGFEIRGLNLDLPQVVGVGLFGFIADGAIIADFVLREPTVVGNGYVGGVVGRGTGLKWNTSTATSSGNGTGPGYTLDSSDGGETGSEATQNMSPALVAKITVSGGTIKGGNAGNAWEDNNAQPMGGVAGLNLFVDFAFIENGATVERGTDGSSWVGGITSCIHNGQLVFAFNSGTVNANGANGGSGRSGTIGGVTAHTLSSQDGADPRATTSGGTGYTSVFDTDTHTEFNNPMVFSVFNQGAVMREDGSSVPVGGVLGLHLLGELENSLNLGSVRPSTGGGDNIGQLVGQAGGNQAVNPTFGVNFVLPEDDPDVINGTVPVAVVGVVEAGATDIAQGDKISVSSVDDFDNIVARMNTTENGQGGTTAVGNLLRGGNEADVFTSESGAFGFVEFYRPGGNWQVPGL